MAVATLTLFALLSSGQAFRDAAPALWHRPLSTDRVTATEARLSRLRTALPARGVVGYLSPVPSQELFQDPTALAQFYLTQYALAPVIVVNDPTPDLVVANFFRGPLPRPAGSGTNLLTIHDFGDGVALLRKSAP